MFNKDKKKKKMMMKEKAAVEPHDAAEEKAPSASGRKGGVVTDPRFVSVHSDPRFKRMPRRQSKIEIDSRFNRMFKDKSFAHFAAPIDKRGKARKGKTENPLLHYYIHQKEPMVGEKAGHFGKLEGMDEQEEDDVSESESTTSSSSEEEEVDDDDQVSMNSEIAHYLMANHEDTPQVEQATHRLAAVNMDWDHIKAVDIFVVMASCLPKDGNILSVAVYPSNFGLECMEIEATKGPSNLICGKEKNSDLDEDVDEDEDCDDEKENRKLRTYELNKLRYYYAAIVCDSSATAEYLYKNLDGTELLKTSNVFDLRFIPDSMEFSKPPRDITSKAPTCYTEPEFHTRALQHSNVKLTWEEEEPKRKKLLRRKYTAEQLEKMDIENFLASEEEESDDEELTEVLNSQVHKPEQGAKYLALLKSSDNSGAEEDGDQDMEITFNTGLEDIAKRALEKKVNKSETVWEAYLRRRKEKRKARKKNAKYSSDDDDDESDFNYQEAPVDPDQPDDFFVEETMETDFKVDKGSNGSLTTRRKVPRHKKQPDDDINEQEATQAELELLCANSNRTDTLNKDDNEKPRKAKGNKRKKLLKEDKLPKEVCMDDPRFSALFNSHLFALDPTDAQFKRSATYARQMLQRQRHGATTKTDESSEQVHPPDDVRYENSSGMQSGEDSMKKDKQKVVSLVKSLKRKAGSLKMEQNIRKKDFS